MIQFKNRPRATLKKGQVLFFCDDGHDTVPVVVVSDEPNGFGCYDVIDLHPTFRKFRFLDPRVLFRHQPDPFDRIIGYSYYGPTPRTVTDAEVENLKANCPDYRRHIHARQQQAEINQTINLLISHESQPV